MQVLKIDGETCSIQASTKDFARLGMLLGWIVDNRSEMDESRISLDQAQIKEVLHKWDKFIVTEVLGRAKELRK